ncbi:MAG: Asp-tRNA(Asn)/Glu-tRNA(Gln) amidotransferase subunit GatC [bacterium]|nr:Asp-tRNA(Asn)/Glu-tRNA(Gln) amidotransferase subunit GatC [bacterium]
MPEKISRDEVLHIARLARLTFSEAEVDRFAEQLSAILTYMEKLDELDTSGVEPTSHVLPLANVFKADETLPSLERDKIMSGGPSTEHGHYKVPKIVE